MNLSLAIVQFNHRGAVLEVKLQPREVNSTPTGRDHPRGDEISSTDSKLGEVTGAPPSQSPTRSWWPIYHMLSHRGCYNELGDLYLDKLNKPHLTRSLVHRLERLGYTVTLQQKAA